MKPREQGGGRRLLVFLGGLLPAFVIAVLAVSRPPLLARFDEGVYDVLLRSIRTKSPSDRIVIVDVDERSLSRLGQWPWRRDLIGQLITRLRDAGASTIALDIIFAERDRNEVRRPADTSAGERQSTPDVALARTLGAGHVVLGYAMTFDRGARARGRCVLHPVGLAIIQPKEPTDDVPYFRATDAVCSLPMLGDAGGASGFLNAAPDSDGILRRAPLLIELEGRVYPSLALAAVAQSTGARDVALRILNVNASLLSVDTRTVPLDGKSSLLLRYRGRKRTFRYVSAADVLGGEVPAGALRDKIVFVGTTALGTREVVATPLDTLFAGVEVQATVADNLLQQDFVGRSPVGATLEALGSLALGILVAFLVAGAGLIPGSIVGACAVASLWWLARSQLATTGTFVSPLSPTVALIAALGPMTLIRLAIERRRAKDEGRGKTTAQRLMVQTLLSLTEARDAETGRHSRRTQRYARLIAEQLAMNPAFMDFLTPERIELLSSLAPLHDIGKVGIPDHILNKPGALTSEELDEMRKHPALGRDVILNAEKRVGVCDDATLAMAKEIVFTHHERCDGTGYPQGLRGTDIPIPGRVMAVVDVYDAAVTRRLYRASISHDEAVRFIVSGAGSQFDPAVVQAFVVAAPAMERVSRELS